MAYACGHPNKSHYSRGMCQNCYLAKYYIKRKQKLNKKLATRELDLIKDYEVTESIKNSQVKKESGLTVDDTKPGSKSKKLKEQT